MGNFIFCVLSVTVDFEVLGKYNFFVITLKGFLKNVFWIFESINFIYFINLFDLEILCNLVGPLFLS